LAERRAEFDGHDMGGRTELNTTTMIDTVKERRTGVDGVIADDPYLSSYRLALEHRWVISLSRLILVLTGALTQTRHP
jgi:hypothetical protein